MAMFKKLHVNNLVQLKSAVRFPGFKEGIWFHADGNMYTSQKESDDRATFYNDHPENIGAAYRKHYTKTDALPSSLEDLEKELIAAHNLETEQKNIEATNVTGAPNLVFAVHADEVEEPAKTVAPAAEASAAPAKSTGGKTTKTVAPAAEASAEFANKPAKEDPGAAK